LAAAGEDPLMASPDVKDLMCNGHTLAEAVRIVGSHEAATEDWAARMTAAQGPLGGGPSRIGGRGPAPSPASQLRHGPGSREYADAMRWLAGEDVRRRQRALDRRLDEQFRKERRW